MPTQGHNGTANRAGNRVAGNLGRPPQSAQNTRNASLGAQSDRNNNRQATPTFRNPSPSHNSNAMEVTDVRTAMTLLNKEGICGPDESPDLFALGEALFNVASTDQPGNVAGRLKAIALILQDMSIHETEEDREMNHGRGITNEGLIEAIGLLKEDWDAMREKMEERMEAAIEAGNKRIEKRVEEMLTAHRTEEREAR
ncbi:hypothetical protein CVT24_008139, partial [Panaeolus cyanescens]